MSTGYLPSEEHAPISRADTPLPDEFIEVWSSSLKTRAETFPEDDSPSDDVLWLLEENARLRALAVKLSNLLGDLPSREWEDAMAVLKSDPARRARMAAFGPSDPLSD
jgi:hypothetical protein